MNNYYSGINQELAKKIQELKGRITALTLENTNLIAKDLMHCEKRRKLESLVQREASAIASSLNALLKAVMGDSPNEQIKILKTSAKRWLGYGKPRGELCWTTSRQ